MPFSESYHGPEGLRRIATKVNSLTHVLKEVLLSLPSTPYSVLNKNFFDTLTISVAPSVGVDVLHAVANESQINLRRIDDKTVGVTLDESVGLTDLLKLVNVFATAAGGDAFHAEQLIKKAVEVGASGSESASFLSEEFRRSSSYLTNPVFKYVPFSCFAKTQPSLMKNHLGVVAPITRRRRCSDIFTSSRAKIYPSFTL